MGHRGWIILTLRSNFNGPIVCQFNLCKLRETVEDGKSRLQLFAYSFDASCKSSLLLHIFLGILCLSPSGICTLFYYAAYILYSLLGC